MKKSLVSQEKVARGWSEGQQHCPEMKHQTKFLSPVINTEPCCVEWGTSISGEEDLLLPTPIAFFCWENDQFQSQDNEYRFLRWYSGLLLSFKYHGNITCQGQWPQIQTIFCYTSYSDWYINRSEGDSLLMSYRLVWSQSKIVGLLSFISSQHDIAHRNTGRASGPLVWWITHSGQSVVSLYLAWP